MSLPSARSGGPGFTWHIATLKKPTIGAINGLAYGGAALLSSTLDIRIGCRRQLPIPGRTTYGRINSSWSLPMVVGWAKAKELLYTGASSRRTRRCR